MEIPAWADAILLSLLGVALMLLWNGHGSRLSTVERQLAEKAAKADVDKAVASFTTAMGEHRKETRQSFDRVFERLDTIVDRMIDKGRS